MKNIQKMHFHHLGKQSKSSIAALLCPRNTEEVVILPNNFRMHFFKFKGSDWSVPELAIQTNEEEKYYIKRYTGCFQKQHAYSICVYICIENLKSWHTYTPQLRKKIPHLHLSSMIRLEDLGPWIPPCRQVADSLISNCCWAMVMSRAHAG